ncbi:MAG TPA: hypothetical protein VMN57_00480 [Anaerolineales bacterium]|nr:hypothetical protein [Anaerolineales bacterium]
MNDEPMSDPMSNEVSSDDRLWAALAYVFSPLVPIILMVWEEKKNRAFIKAHTVQALVAGIIFIILSSVTLGCGSVVWLLMLWWAYKAYQGEMVEIPVISNLVKNQGWA